MQVKMHIRRPHQEIPMGGHISTVGSSLAVCVLAETESRKLLLVMRKCDERGICAAVCLKSLKAEDRGHHTSGKTWKEIKNGFMLLSARAPIHILGLDSVWI